MSTTTIWKIQVPVGSGFAELNRHYKEPKGEECEECGSIFNPIHEPLTVEWDDGSDQVGDFVNAGNDIVLQDRVVEQLRQIASGFTTSAIQFFDHPNLRKPEVASGHRISSRNHRIWLPYEGPPLSQLVVERRVPLADRSTVEIDFVCQLCGTIQYKRILGVEKKNSATSKPRVDGQGLYVHADDLNDDDIFAPIGLFMTLCTNRVKVFIESKGFSNVEFLEYGDLV